MSSEGTVTQWIVGLKDGDLSALQKIHDRYRSQLVGLARHRLCRQSTHQGDAEDAVQEAFWSFFRTVQQGRLPRLENRDDLLSLLVIITARKTSNLIRGERAAKRGGGRVRDEAALAGGDADSTPGIGQVADSVCTPDEEVQLRDAYEHYLAALPEALRVFAELFLAGYSPQEIALQLGCSDQTVRRKIKLILQLWQEMAAESLRD